MRLKSALFTLPLSLLLLAPHATFADTLTLTGATGSVVDGVYTYPYEFTVTGPGGTSENVQMSCLNFDREISFNETWSVTPMSVLSIGAGGIDGESQKSFLEDAWLFNQYAGASAQQTVDLQFAIWDIMDPSGVAGDLDNNAKNLVAGALAAYNNGVATDNFSFAANDLVFIPVLGSQPRGDGEPQIFMVDPPPAAVTPEPSSLLLFGTGLLGMTGIIRRKMLQTQAQATA